MKLVRRTWRELFAQRHLTEKTAYGDLAWNLTCASVLCVCVRCCCVWRAFEDGAARLMQPRLNAPSQKDACCVLRGAPLDVYEIEPDEALDGVPLRVETLSDHALSGVHTPRPLVPVPSHPSSTSSCAHKLYNHSLRGNGEAIV